MLLAEKKCSKKKNSNYDWSPELAKAGSELSYPLLIKRSRKRLVHPELLEKARIHAQTSIPLHMSHKKCQELMGTLHLSGSKEVHIPQEDSETASNSVSSWKSISDPQEIVDHIIKQNDVQFSQVRFTPLADTTLGRRIGRYGDTQATEQLLSGTFETSGLSAEIGRLLQSFS